LVLVLNRESVRRRLRGSVRFVCLAVLLPLLLNDTLQFLVLTLIIGDGFGELLLLRFHFEVRFIQLVDLFVQRLNLRHVVFFLPLLLLDKLTVLI